MKKEGVTDSIRGAAEIQTEYGEGDVIFNCEISDVLDCYGCKLNPSIGSIPILLLVNY